MEFRFCQTKKDNMTSNFVIVAIKVCLDVGNDEYIILCNFSGSSIISGFEVRPRSVAGNKKQPALNRVKLS